MDLRIIEDYIKAIEPTHFQDFCDRLLLKLYPNDYTPIRAANGDMKNDGFCYFSRIFFQAHATRGESPSVTKRKINDDFAGCINQWTDVLEFIYITNDTLTAPVEKTVEDLRQKHPPIKIATWTPKILIEKIKVLPEKEIEYIIERNISGTNMIFNNQDGSKVINQGDINIDNQTINY
jgi:hypothetical protein